MKIKKNIKAAEGSNTDTLVLTTSALLAFLSQIEELEDVDIAIGESDDKIKVVIGENEYILESPEDSTVEVETEVVDTIDAINEDGFDEIEEEGTVERIEVEDGEPIEGGIIKELVKTLAVGGLVRLTKHALQNA